MTTNQKPPVQKVSLKDQIVAILSGQGFNDEDVDMFASYCQRLLIEVDKKTGKPKNPFMATKTAEALSKLFKRVANEGLKFDGKHVSLQSTGISYDYVAYKNKMLSVYPETKLDMSVVCEGDTFNFRKEDGKIIYSHVIGDAFNEKKAIIGAYAIIKNQRGEFLTTLNKEEIAKHRKVAKQDYIWSAWFKEMVLKTVLKKGLKYHFEDEFESMNETDNESSIDLSHMVTTDEDDEEVKKVIAKLETFTDLKELQAYYKALPTQFIKNNDVFEAYTAQKNICKPTK